MSKNDGVIRFGVIGCGVIGPQHMTGISKVTGATLLAVADIDGSRARVVAEKFGAERVYTDPMKLLDDPDVDAVILALPAGLRADLAVESVRRGKHTMLEKPAGRNVAEVDAIAEAWNAVEGRKPIIAGASARYLCMPHSGPVRDYITSGKLGNIRTIHFRNLVPPGPPPDGPAPGWRVNFEMNGGGILVNWSSYEIDYILGITGWQIRPRYVLARWWPIPPLFENYVAPGSDADEHYSAMITCDNGTAIYLERGERVPGEEAASMKIIGDRGDISLSIFPEENKRIIAREFSPEMREVVVWEGDETWDQMPSGFIGDFAHAIATGGQPQTNLERSRVIQQIFDAIYLSGNENRPVEIR